MLPEDIEPGRMYWGGLSVRHVVEITKTATSCRVCYEKVVLDPVTGPYRKGMSETISMERFLKWVDGEFKEDDDINKLQAGKLEQGN